MALALAALGAGAASAADFPVSTTLSVEAKAVAGSFSLAARNAVRPAPDDVDGWKQLHDSVEDELAEENAQLLSLIHI